MKKATVYLIIIILLLTIACSRKKEPDYDFTGNYFFSSISIEGNHNIDISRYKDLSKNKTFSSSIPDYYKTDFELRQSLDDYVYIEINKMLNISDYLDENMYIIITKDNSGEYAYKMLSNFWVLIRRLSNNLNDDYIEYAFEHKVNHELESEFLSVIVEEYISPPFRVKENLDISHIENYLVINYSYSASYLENTVIYEEIVADELAVKMRVQKKKKTENVIWTPYNEIMKCIIYFKNNI
jgi:hypothetical protein